MGGQPAAPWVGGPTTLGAEARAAFYASLPEHIRPFGRAEFAFCGWLEQRSLLGAQALHQWWGQVHQAIVRDSRLAAQGARCCGPTTAWAAFFSEPTVRRWYVAHNSSVFHSALRYRYLAAQEPPEEQHLIARVLHRVLLLQACAESGSPCGRWISDPRGGLVERLLRLPSLYPVQYPTGRPATPLANWVDGTAVQAALKPGLGPSASLYARAADWLCLPALRTFQHRGKLLYPHIGDLSPAEHHP